MKEMTKSGQPIWNGAEQLFQAAKDYGITVCFANPGKFCLLIRDGQLQWSFMMVYLCKLQGHLKCTLCQQWTLSQVFERY